VNQVKKLLQDYKFVYSIVNLWKLVGCVLGRCPRSYFRKY